MKFTPLLLALALGICGCQPANKTTSNDKSTKPDNTGVNERDQNGTKPTPIDQKENQSDVEKTTNIRKSITDGDFSVNARNVKIITMDGKVTLRGPVDTQDEKDRIGAIAVKVAGANNVVNELEVVPAK